MTRATFDASTGHCPEGVDEPENPPTEEQLDEAGETVPEGCVPHGDHCKSVLFSV